MNAQRIMIVMPQGTRQNHIAERNTTMTKRNTTLNVTLMIFAGAAVLIASQPAFGGLLAYEPVDGYNPGDLVGQTHLGAGFDAARTWAENNVGSGHFVNVVAGGLTYSQGGADLVTSGSQHVEMAVINGGVRGWVDVAPAGPFSAYISPGQDRINQGTVYFSFVGNANDSGSWQGRGTLTYNTAINHPAEMIQPQDSVNHLYAGKIEFNAGAGGEDLFSLWLDPTPGTSEGATGTQIDNQVDLTADGDWQDGINMWMPRGGDFQAWDEVRFGETWADVTPAAGPEGEVPEPCTLVLAAMGLMGLGGYARKRRRV